MVIFFCEHEIDSLYTSFLAKIKSGNMSFLVEVHDYPQILADLEKNALSILEIKCHLLYLVYNSIKK